MENEQGDQKTLQIHQVSSFESSEFTYLTRCLARSSVIALDAEWKPIRTTFPTVSLLQLACQLTPRVEGDSDETVVFLLDLLSLPLSSIWELLREIFESPDVLKLGFRFKQDLIYLSSTFSSQECCSGFTKMEPFLDITSIYDHLQHKQTGKKMPRETKSLSTICKEVLGFSLSKALQCSDWSLRPLTEEQKFYAAMDAHCLLEIFNIFQAKAIKGNSSQITTSAHSPNLTLGLKEVLEKHETCKRISSIKFCALEIVRASDLALIVATVNFRPLSRYTKPMDEPLWKLVRRYGGKILLKESDKMPKATKRRGKKRSPMGPSGERRVKFLEDWQGPPPWDFSLGGDGCPKFLCDVMVEGLAKHLRCVGIDAAIPYSKKPEPRELVDQALKEKRVLLTRDTKLLRYEYLLKKQIYRVKSLLKNEQLLEVIGTFQLRINEDQLMSRCTKCNGGFVQKPLTTQEAIEAAKGFQRIPNCLFDKNLEFWQCRECNQLYWEGTQYHNAVQKFIDVCKLNE